MARDQTLLHIGVCDINRGTLVRMRRDGAEHGSVDDRPFIVLTETKFSFRCIPVWIGTLL